MHCRHKKSAPFPLEKILAGKTGRAAWIGARMRGGHGKARKAPPAAGLYFSSPHWRGWSRKAFEPTVAAEKALVFLKLLEAGARSLLRRFVHLDFSQIRIAFPMVRGGRWEGWPGWAHGAARSEKRRDKKNHFGGGTSKCSDFTYPSGRSRRRSSITAQCSCNGRRLQNCESRAQPPDKPPI